MLAAGKGYDMRKLCIITRSLQIHSIGGLERYIEILTDELKQRHWEISVISAAHPNGVLFEEIHGIKYHYVPNTQPIYNKQWWRYIKDAFFDLHKREHFDIVQLHQNAGNSILADRNRPSDCVYIVTLHGTILMNLRYHLSCLNFINFYSIPFHFIQMSKILFHFFSPYNGRKIFSEENIIVISDRQLKDSLRLYNLDKRKIKRIYHGVDTKHFRPFNTEATMILKEKIVQGRNAKNIIFTASRFEHYKGIHCLLKAIRYVINEYPSTILLLAGEGPYERSLRRMSEKLGIARNVIFLGRIAPNKMVEFYNISDMFVCPSIIEESLGFVVLEAMSCGKPVIASKIGSLPEIIDKENVNGYLFQPKNSKVLANRIIDVILKRGNLEKVEVEARKRVKTTFSKEQMIKKTEAYFLSLIRENQLYHID